MVNGEACMSRSYVCKCESRINPTMDQFLIYSDTPFEDLERLGVPAHFDIPGSTG